MRIFCIVGLIILVMFCAIKWAKESDERAGRIPVSTGGVTFGVSAQSGKPGISLGGAVYTFDGKLEVGF